MMFYDSAAQQVLDLSKNSKIKTEDPLQDIKIPLQDIKIPYHLWKEDRFALNMPHSPKREQETSDECSRSFSSTSENKSIGCGSPESSSESMEPYTRPARRRSSRVEIKDETYLERRRKNNLAAKKSRDAKRERERLTKKKIIILEEENKKLKMALSQCACGGALKNSAVFLPNPYNFPIPFAEPRFIPVRAELRS